MAKAPWKTRTPLMIETQLDMSPTLKQLATVMMANPARVWVSWQLEAEVGFPVQNYLYKFRRHNMIQKSIAAHRAFSLTSYGRSVLGEVLEGISQSMMTGAQQIQARKLARQIVDALPEEMADRLVLTRDNVIHVIADNGEAYALTITPR